MLTAKSNRLIFDTRLKAAKGYWIQQLSRERGKSNVKLDFERLVKDPVSMERVNISIPEAASKKLAKITGNSDSLLYAYLLAVLKVCLQKYNGSSSIIVGSPSLRREGQVHQPPNALAIINEIDIRESFRTFLLRVQATLRKSFEHQDYPFARLVEDLGIPAVPGRYPLFDVVLALSNIHTDLPEIGNDLTIILVRSANGIAGDVAYRSDLFREITIRRFIQHYFSLLCSALESSETAIGDLQMLTEPERQRLLVEWNDTEDENSSNCGIIQIFEEQVRKAPDAVALSYEDAHLSYDELNCYANQLGHYLRARRVGPEVIVGIYLERSLEMIIGLLGALKAGGAYLPLDTGYPAERLSYMLEQTQVSVLLTRGDLRRELSNVGTQLIELDREWEAISGYAVTNPGVEVAETQLAYVIYTSGSTGRPKGVGLTHAGMRNLALAQRAAFGIVSGTVVLQFASLSFDASVSEWTTALLSGGKLVLKRSNGALAGNELRELLEQEEVEVATIPPSVLASVGRIKRNRVRTLVVAGEPCPEGLVREWADGRQMLDAYGPTETTVCATISGSLSVERGVVLGRPMSNVRVYVIDRCGDFTAVGATGEIYVGGVGLGRGYLNDARQTAERFMPDAYSGEAGGRLYRTGDEVRWREDGNLEYVGRLDTQVKLRGYRIELGEIEAVLGQKEGVRQCAVTLREDEPGDQRLVAYVVPSGQDVFPDWELREYLRRRLPDYMAPSAFVTLEQLPLSANGKLDRKALPAPAMAALADESASPRTPVEEIVAGIFAQVLRMEWVGVDGNFFELGGHSLVATQVISRLRETLEVELPLRVLFESPTVAELAEAVERERQASRRVEAPPIALARRDRELPLSFAQQRLWFIQQLEPESAAYNIPQAVRRRGDLDINGLGQSLGEVARRHEALRTRFVSRGGIPIQVIAEAAEVKLSVWDLSEVEEDLREELARQISASEARRPFDLERGPVWRAALVRMGAKDHMLLLCLHHAASDGWSGSILVREFSELYHAYTQGLGSRLSELAVQYADYALWQREWLQGEALEEQLNYWKGRLAGAPELKLPTDRPRPTAPNWRGARAPFRLSAELTRRLKEMSQREGVTLFMTLLAGFQLLLSRYAGQEDVAVGTPIANRDRLEVEGLIGFFVNQLVLRTDLSGSPNVRQLLERTRESAMGAYEHQYVPFEKLVEELGPERDLSRAPLFQVMLAFQNAPKGKAQSSGVRLEVVNIESGSVKFDLTLALAEGREGVSGTADYAVELYDEASIERLLKHLRQVLEAMTADAEQRIGEISILTESERQQALVEWNATDAEYPIEQCLQGLFEQQAARKPEAVAVAHEERQLSYEELNRRANQLGHYLRSLGVGPEITVGVYVERSLEMVTGLLGVLKAGGAYVPLDPNYPKDRLGYILEETQAQALLTQERLRDRLPEHGARVVSLDSDWEAIGIEDEWSTDGGVTAGNLAYVIYTSGSTGRPKGVAIEHRNAVALVHWAKEVFTEEELGGVLASTSICFDLSVFELFVTLSSGGKVILAENALQLPDLPAARGVTLVNTVPSAMAELVRMGGVPRSARCVNLAGEPLKTRLVEDIYRQEGIKRVFDLYGPSEDTTYSTYALRSAAGPATIGRPIANTQVYLLDNHMCPAPVGAIGELCLGGDGLSRCYFRRGELTAERWIPNPFGAEAGERLYRTGDLARYLPDGNLEYLGRQDHQVKIRGFRIELGEIETLLSQHKGINQCAVSIREDQTGDKRLVAYIVGDGERTPRDTELREYLRGKLPEFMAPSAYVELAELPLTPNGKLNRRALPVPAAIDKRECVEARTPIEEIVSGIWCELLRLERVSVRQNFFELGGHSLLATQVISRVREAFEVDLPLRVLFESPTVEGLAAVVERERQAGRRAEAPPIAPARRDRELPLSFAQQRLWFIQQLEPESAAYNMPYAIRLRGELSINALGQSLGEVARRHEALRTRFASRGGRPVQVIDEAAEVTPAVWDLSDVGEDLRETLARQIASAEAGRRFDLEQDAVWRATLVRMGKEDHILLLCLHHVASDGWSTGVMERESTRLYEALGTGNPSPLAELPVQYADFALWQREWLQGEALQKQIDYWRRRLAGSRTLELPADRPRPAAPSHRGANMSFQLSTELTDELKALSRREGVSLFMTLLAAFQLTLGRYAGQDDVVVGTDVANRNRLETEELIGFFVNQLVLRTDLSGDLSFGELLRRVRETTLGAYAHQDVPFEKLVEELEPERSFNRTPIFQVLFVLENASVRTGEWRNLIASPFALNSSSSKFDWVVVARETRDGVSGIWRYNIDMFEASTIEQLCFRFQALLEKIAASPEVRVKELDMIIDASQKSPERARLPKSFGKARPRTVIFPQESLVSASFLSSEQTLPLVITPAVGDIDLIEWAGTERDFIERNLLKHGAILFRGFKTAGPGEFEDFASVICPELFEEYGDLPRESIGGKVYSSTPYPNDQAILFHNESSHLHSWPLKIWFYCLTPPQEGGETPVVDCRSLYSEMDPALRQKFYDKGLMYVRNFGDGLDVSWQDFFKTSDRAAVEEFCRNSGILYEWKAGNALRTKRLCPAVAHHPRTGESVFFNQIQAHHVSCLDPTARQILLSQFGEKGLPRNVYYGDGESISDSVVNDLRQLYERHAKSFLWRKGDILMVDNMLVAHGRRPFAGSRKIVVAMGDMISCAV